VKSNFLAPISSRSDATKALSAALPKEMETRLLKDNLGDIAAYFSLVESDSVTGFHTIQVDLSGRHYNSDEDILSVLQKLKAELGGNITNDA
jgi:hypothetical protein